MEPNRHPAEPYFEIYADAGGEWRWRLVAANGEIVASGESYRDRTDARRAVAAVKTAVYGEATAGIATQEHPVG